MRKRLLAPDFKGPDGDERQRSYRLGEFRRVSDPDEQHRSPLCPQI